MKDINAMRKFILFCMFGLLLASCTNQELATTNDEDASSASSFLSVSIVTTGRTGTRATGDYNPNNPGDPGYYEDENYRDGTVAESYVKDVLFLFFDKDGKPATATKEDGKYLSYFLWENINDDTTGNGDKSETVEKILEKTITITVPQNQAKPAQLLVVVNPPSDYKTTLVPKSLTQLRAHIDDYESYLYATTGSDNEEKNRGKFVMTNSVFADGNETDGYETIDAKALNDDNFRPTVEEAQQDDYRVVVYVERILARLDLFIGIDDNPKLIGEGENAYYIYYTGNSIPDEKKDMDQGVYVRFLGWNVFDTPNKSRLVKHINPNWTDTGVFGDAVIYVGPWNAPSYHRSFWAINPSVNDFSYKVGMFTMGEEANDEDFNSNSQWTADHFAIPDREKYTTVYFQENAAPISSDEPSITDYISGSPIKPSKIILAAQLVDANGNARELAKWGGKYYTWDGLKAELYNNLNLWELVGEENTKNENGGTTTTKKYSKITIDDLGFSTSPDTYKVTITLSDAGKEKTWYQKIVKGEGEKEEYEFKELTTDEANQSITDVVGEKTVKLWKNGYTYFYLTIRHLGGKDSPAYYGIVRNHIYETTIKSLSGLGTPVADPEKDIVITETTPPSEDDYEGVLAAEVKVLSWRVVSQSYDLNW